MAYRPLRRRNARPLTFLITAIGMSFVLQEFVHFILPQIIKGYGGSNAQQPIIMLVQPKTQFHIFSATVSNVTWSSWRLPWCSPGPHRHRHQPNQIRRGIRRWRRTPVTATLMGCRGADHHDDVPHRRHAGRCRCAAVHPESAAGIIYSGGFLLGIKAFSAAVLAASATCAAHCCGGLILGIMENYGQAVFGTQWRDVVAFVLLVLVLLIRPTGILGESLGKARA